MDLDLKDKVAIVTGAGSESGFGYTTALTLAKEGCDIVVNDVNLEGAEKTAAEIKTLGRKAIAVKADVSDITQMSELVNKALDQFGKVDIMINNAGVGRSGGPIHMTKEEDWDNTINSLFKGVMIGTRAVLPHMLEREYGKIINIASDDGENGTPNFSVYSACEAAVINFTKSLSGEVGDKGIIVNCICPGLSEATIVRGPEGQIPSQEEVETITKTPPIKRLTEPQDVANIVTFLVSDVANDIVGQPIYVNGGLFRMLRMSM